MIRQGLAAVTGIVLAAGVWGAAASAAGLGGLKDGVASEGGLASGGLVHKVWGCHRSCEVGPAGWHRHVGPYCRRVSCSPRAQHPNRCFVDRWGVRHCRW
jgi:hypothetical protein